MITKSDFLIYLEAPRHFWALKHNQYEEQLSDFDKHLIKQGYIVEQKAREYALKYILPHYSDDAKDILFQKTCENGKFEARTDIFVRDSKTNTWDIYEVKSVTKPEKEHYYDATFQTIIFKKNFNINKTYLLHVNGDYIREKDFDLGLFLKAEDVTQKVEELTEETEKMMQNCIFLLETNNYKLATECYKPKKCNCKKLCFPDLPEQSIYDLSRVTEKKILQLRDLDVLDIKDIPDGFNLTENQRIQAQVAKNNTNLVDKTNIKNELSLLEYPLYFLDYESFNPAIPMYEGYKPYQHMVFQYSLHVLNNPDGELKHYEYIVDKDIEPSKELLKSLREQISEQGTILVWHKSFECTRNKEMGELNKEYSYFMEDVNNKTYDLKDIFSKNYYVDQRFKGSNSIKDVLPVIVPNLSYKNLEIQNGSRAMIDWHKMIYETTNTKEKETIKNNLLKYCELDTLAMVRIWEFLKNLI